MRNLAAVLGTIKASQTFESIIGPKGDPGDVGPAGVAGPIGLTGADGLGVPSGGTAGQVLTKIDSADNNTQWTTAASIMYFELDANGDIEPIA